MKRFFILALSAMLCVAVSAQNHEKFQGAWDFDTETGAAGYESGVVKISEESLSFIFTDIPDDYPSDWIKYESDTLKFEFDVDGTLVGCWLVAKDAEHLEGYADWDSGETVLHLTRKKAEE
jgi:hypothetical protein